MKKNKLTFLEKIKDTILGKNCQYLKLWISEYKTHKNAYKYLPSFKNHRENGRALSFQD